MKKIKEAIINADPRMKGLLVVMIAYIGIVATTLNAGATNQIDNYVETIDVKVQDGNQDQKDYLIRQASVSSVLDDLKISVNPQDILNLDLNYIVNKGDLIQITRVNQADIDEMITVESNTVNTTGLELFTTKVAQQGQNGQVKNTYRVTYENGNEVGRELIGSQVVSQATDTIIETCLLYTSLLLDEPTTYLDVKYQIEILNLIKEINKKYQMTIIMVHHDINQAINYSDEIIAMKDGKILFQGVPEEVITSASLKSLYDYDLSVIDYNHQKIVLNLSLIHILRVLLLC